MCRSTDRVKKNMPLKNTLHVSFKIRPRPIRGTILSCLLLRNRWRLLCFCFVCLFYSNPVDISDTITIDDRVETEVHVETKVCRITLCSNGCRKLESTKKYLRYKKKLGQYNFMKNTLLIKIKLPATKNWNQFLVSNTVILNQLLNLGFT